MSRLLVLFFLTTFIISCSSDQSASSKNADRPLDPWVFRSVLDQNPRMITAALNNDLYVAYHTETGAMYKAWKGLVNFEGAVYNTAHGPQPTAVGDAYLINNYREPWTLLKEGKPVESDFRYLGHRIADGELELLYRLSGKDNMVDITERVERTESESGQLGLKRSFRTTGLSAPYTIEWKSNVGSVVDQSQVKSTGNMSLSEPKDRIFDNRNFLDIDVTIQLDKDETIELDVLLLDATYLDPNLDDGFAKDIDALPIGAQLIAKNDCKTCHNQTKVTIGPSYESIARRYEHTDENVVLLAGKIKEGGSGIWGDQVMTAHPEALDLDLRDMVKYIFTLADFEGETASEDDDLISFSSVQVEENNLVPGAMTRIYNLNAGTDKLPLNMEKGKAVQAGILSGFDNISGGDFIGLEDNFGIVANGYINIEKEGDFEFRLWSDDGSKLYLHDQLVIDHDGLHGTSMKQASMKLSKGLHPFKIEYFQGRGGKMLSWNYKNAGDDKWTVVPKEIISHHKDDHNMIGQLSLPMSVVTRIPGDRYPVDGVHPSFDLYQARPDEFTPKVGGMDFLSDGRMVISTWTTKGGVYILDGVGGKDPSQIKVKRIAAGLAEPLGLCVVNDRIFLNQKQEITELIDLNGDEIIDEFRTICNAWGVSANFHEFTFGLIHKEGYLYANLATGILPGGAGMPNQHPDRGSTIKVSIADGSYEIMANGLRTPNGIGFGFNDGIYVADNQGDWLPSSKIVHIEKGDWFGSRAVDYEGTASKKEKLPVVWLPQDEIGNSPSTPLGLDYGPYKGQMIHGEVTHGGIKRVFVEEVEGQLQGCVFRFIQGLEAGVNRIQYGPDGHLYVGGIGNPGNWQHTGTSWYGLQRLEFNDKPAFEMLSVKAKSDGVEIEFTEALRQGDGWSPEDYQVKQWYYKPTAEYGGPKLDDKELSISGVSVSKDRKKVSLKIDGMKEGHVLYVRLMDHFVSENNNSLWSTESWYTMNKIPLNDPVSISNAASMLLDNALTEYEKSQGWELLFDGSTMDEFHTFNKDFITKKWRVDNGTIHFDPTVEDDGGDLVTNEEYENFELQLEWKISNCGNSGIMWNVVEDEKYCCPYLTGPEMQILDNTCHPDTKFRTHRAGDLYDMIETKYVTVRPAGEWNKVRIISDNGDMQFWLNGYNVVSFKMHDDNWTEMITNSKFKDWEDFGLARKGKIVLQDHADKVWFRNLKIRKL
ncbi:MAG: DUF1080 domain-containing protein [Saprospiraceae bacterium]|nr:DUF1080 domain-containing protein [Saprospiraceae bacterium]